MVKSSRRKRLKPYDLESFNFPGLLNELKREVLGYFPPENKFSLEEQLASLVLSRLIITQAISINPLALIPEKFLKNLDQSIME